MHIGESADRQPDPNAGPIAIDPEHPPPPDALALPAARIENRIASLGGVSARRSLAPDPARQPAKLPTGDIHQRPTVASPWCRSPSDTAVQRSLDTNCQADRTMAGYPGPPTSPVGSRRNRSVALLPLAVIQSRYHGALRLAGDSKRGRCGSFQSAAAGITLARDGSTCTPPLTMTTCCLPTAS